MTPQIFSQVPWDAAMPAGPQTALIVLNSAIALLAAVFVLMELRRRRDWVPLYLAIGAGLAIVYEPLGDILVSVLYPLHGQLTWIEAFGRRIPVFIGVLYFWYMAVPPLVFLRALETGLSGARLWRMYAGMIVFAVVYEIAGVSLGSWIYYGPQPFMLLDVPLWAPFTYAGFVFVICGGTALLLRNLARRHHWLLVPAVPLLLAGGHCAVALPGAAAMLSTAEAAWIWLGASGSIALSLLVTWMVGLMFCSDASAAPSSGSTVRRLDRLTGTRAY